MAVEKNTRQTSLYNFKSFGAKLLDCDEGTRRVKVYLSAFGNIDSDRDRIIKGAFAKSIMERGPKSASNRQIAYLRMHDWNKQVGKWLELSEDDYGLVAVGQLGRSSQGEDAMFDYQDGIIKEHSIGFRYVTDKMKMNDADDCFDIFEVQLWEGSAVTFGANSETFVIDVAKGLDKQSHLKALNEEMETLLKALREGKGTDERMHAITMGLNVIQSKYNKLVTYEPQDMKKCTHCTGEKHQPGELTDAEKQAKEVEAKKKQLLIINSY
jgi:HK97 family phage prohead protease